MTVTPYNPEEGGLDPVNQALTGIASALAHLNTNKADRSEVLSLQSANRKLEAKCAELESQMHFLHHGREYWTVQALVSAIGVTAGKQEKQDAGSHLTRLSTEMGIPKIMRPDDRFPKGVGTYHPFVIKRFCEMHEIAMPLPIKFAKDPR